MPIDATHPYDPDNIFARILRDEIRAKLVRPQGVSGHAEKTNR